MTNAEQKTVDQLYKLMSDMRTENATFKSEVQQLVDNMNKKVDAKHMPIQLEMNILSDVQRAMDKAIVDTLSGYNSPLTGLIKSVVDSRSGTLREIISSAFDAVISTHEFKQSIVNAFSHKVAKTIISNNDGLFDKVSNELKQDAIFKSKMQLAVSNVVNECITGKHQ